MEDRNKDFVSSGVHSLIHRLLNPEHRVTGGGGSAGVFSEVKTCELSLGSALEKVTGSIGAQSSSVCFHRGDPVGTGLATRLGMCVSAAIRSMLQVEE